MREIWELQQMQSLPLSAKIQMTRSRVKKWIDTFGEDKVYISFSGGKDSTVLLDLVRNEFGYKDIKAMFVDVPTQYPELRQFVKTFDNVDIVQPKINFFQVCEKYGFPLFSKEISECVQGARKYLTSILNEQESLTDRQTDRPYRYWYERVQGIGNYTKVHASMEQTPRNIPSRGGMTQSIEDYKELASLLNERKKNRSGGNNQRLAIMLGMFAENGEIKANIPSKDRSQFSLEAYKFMLDAPFEISNKCCNIMKKNPAHRYAKETGRKPITAQMASESRLRTQVWLRNGCNAFEVKNPISNPMSFWTEQDVLRYIKDKGIKICSVYGEVVTDDEEIGQMQLSDYAGMELFDLGQQCLHCTGCDRTGCVLCGFGAHLDDRFVRLRETHPKMYALLDKATNSGYTMRQAIDWISEHSNKIIKY